MAAYEYALNLHVFDKNGQAVPNAEVIVFVDGKEICSGITAGERDRPLKLRANTNSDHVKVVARRGNDESYGVFPITQRDATIILAHTEMPSMDKKSAWLDWGAAVVGVLLLLLLLGLAELNPNPSSNLTQIRLVILAISVAAFGSAISGFLFVDLRSERLGYAIRAGGAIALFVLTYFFAPTALK